MDISIYLDKTLNEEESSFLFSLIKEFTKNQDKIIVFLSENACYQLDMIYRQIFRENNISRDNILNIELMVDLHEYQGLGIESINTYDKFRSEYIKFLDHETFMKNYLKVTSNLNVRYIHL